MDTSDVPEDIVGHVRAICARLPEVAVGTNGWGHTFQIRRRMVAYLVAPEDREGRPVPVLIVRSTGMEREVLAAAGHPFFAPRNTPDRLGIALDDATDWEEVAELIAESYRMLAPKKLVALLHDDPPPPYRPSSSPSPPPG